AERPGAPQPGGGPHARGDPADAQVGRGPLGPADQDRPHARVCPRPGAPAVRDHLPGDRPRLRPAGARARPRTRNGGPFRRGYGRIDRSRDSQRAAEARTRGATYTLTAQSAGGREARERQGPGERNVNVGRPPRRTLTVPHPSPAPSCRSRPARSMRTEPGALWTPAAIA